MANERIPQYSIGTIFHTRGKGSRECTVVDIYFTRNLKGELIHFRYIAMHKLMGQMITGEYVETSIAMGSPRAPE